MTFDDDGNLYVATGNAAVIYMLPKDFQTNDTPSHGSSASKPTSPHWLGTLRATCSPAAALEESSTE